MGTGGAARYASLMQDVSRRHFLTSAAAVSAGFAGLRAFAGDGDGPREGAGYGPLTSAGGPLDLPPGFKATVFSRTGEEMDDGLLVPALHDGMGAFPGPDGLTILVRNHELEPAHGAPGAFGANNERLGRIDKGKLFDRGARSGEFAGPSRGGTTTLLYDTRTQRVRSQWLSLAGTERNCAGGPTPRNTWISCEEAVFRAGEQGRAVDHGWCFEVPASARMELTTPKPIRAMGRFYHEAVATNPYTGVVYQTEDRHDGVLFRYVPNNPDRLLEGGRLQSLAVRGRPRLDTRNWDRSPEVSVGAQLACEWIDVEDVESSDDSLRYQMFEKGCARFARGEGMWFGRGAVFFACTNGGSAKAGQVWKYTPAPPAHEGRASESSNPGTLELFIEPNLPGVMENADNVTVAPWGDLIVCEDGKNSQFLIGVTPKGEVYKLARNRINTAELAGACFSPDGSTLFVNVQYPGLSIAITGPWGERR